MKNALTRNKLYLLIVTQMLVVILGGFVYIDGNGTLSTTAKATQLSINTNSVDAIASVAITQSTSTSSTNDIDVQIDEQKLYRDYLKEQRKLQDTYYVITAGELNVRESASKESKRLGVYKKNDVVQILAKEGDWYKTTEGYIHSGYVQQLDAVGGDVSIAKMDAKKVALSRGGNISFELNVGQRTNVSLDQLKTILDGTALEGIEEAVYNVEQEYGINAFFIIAVARLESGNGTSDLAKYKNNLFGLNATGRNAYKNAYSFKSKGECIYAFGATIKKNYVNRGLDTPRKINPVYCPPNSKWAGMITSMMRESYAKIN